MAAIADPILRVVLFVLSVIALGVSAGYVAGSAEDSPRVRFAVFAAAFSILFGVFWGLAAAFIEFLSFPIVTATFDFLNWVFLFTGATAIAAKIRCHSCNSDWYLLEYFDGSKRDCRLAQTSVAFLYFSFAVAVGLFVYSLLSALKGGSFGMPSRRSVPRTGVPTMSQV